MSEIPFVWRCKCACEWYRFYRSYGNGRIESAGKAIAIQFLDMRVYAYPWRKRRAARRARENA